MKFLNICPHDICFCGGVVNISNDPGIWGSSSFLSRTPSGPSSASVIDSGSSWRGISFVNIGPFFLASLSTAGVFSGTGLGSSIGLGFSSTEHVLGVGSTSCPFTAESSSTGAITLTNSFNPGSCSNVNDVRERVLPRDLIDISSSSSESHCHPWLPDLLLWVANLCRRFIARADAIAERHRALGSKCSRNPVLRSCSTDGL